MKLLLTTNDGELLEIWQIKKGDPDYADDLNDLLDDDLYINEIKKCHNPLGDVQSNILRHDCYGKE